MKFVSIGLSLVSFTNALGTTRHRIGDCDVATDKFQDQLAKFCADNEDLVRFCLENDLDICPAEEELELEITDNSRSWDDMITDVHEYCKQHPKKCNKKWGGRILPRLNRFRIAMDGLFQKDSVEHYKSYMSIANEQCYESVQSCSDKITSVESVALPTSDNSWDTSCVRCFVKSMLSIEIHEGDIAVSGIDKSNCVGKFCLAIMDKKALLAKIEKKEEKLHGAKNNALTADILNYSEWKEKKNGIVKYLLNRD